MDKILNPYKELGASYREIRLSLCLSQRAMGDLINETQSTISRWEAGRSVPDVLQARTIDLLSRSIAIERMTGKDLRVF